MNFKKLAVSLCPTLCVFFLLGSQALAAPSHTRLSGQDRYGTSTAISKSWDTSEYAVIAYGEDFPDALCSAPLAKKHNAPILLVSKDSLDSRFGGANDTKVSAELARLQVRKVFVVGGTGVVSENVVNQIKAISNNGKQIEVERIAGQDRFETALEVAKKVGAEKGVVVTTGFDFPDALSISPIAAAKGMPIILVQKELMNENVTAYLDQSNYLSKGTADQNAPKTYIIGGTGVVGQSIENQFANKKRLAGVNAYETNVSVLKEFEGDLDYSTAFISTRNDFPDALAGSALSSVKISPIILTGDIPENVTSKFLNSKFDSINSIKVLGGEGAVKPQTIQKLVLDTVELKEILQASANTTNAKSMENISEIAIKADAAGLPQDVQEQLNAILPLINNMKLTINTKSNSNDDKTLLKSFVDMSVDSELFPFEMNVWMDANMSGEKPSFKQIIRLSELMKSSLPEEFVGKEYMIIDSSDMTDEGSNPFGDYSEYAQINKQFQDQLAKLIEDYVAEPGSKDFVTYKGEQSVTTADGAKNAKVYEVKLNNEILEKFMSYAGADAESLKAIKELNIFGAKGITLTYYIADGFIISNDAVIDLNIDLGKLGTLLGDLEQGSEGQGEMKGIVKLELNLGSKNYNINKDVNIVFPQTNESNSFNLKDMESF